jgi:beta-lactam-binding protein with PASTA domain
MARFTRERLMRAGLAVALLAGVLAATFGAGYRTSNAVLDGASAYVQRGHSVVRVNAESRTTDAQAAAAKRLALGNQRLEVVQVSPGVVYVVNNQTGQVWRLPTDSMLPTKVPGVPTGQTGAAGGPQVVAGGNRAYLLDRRNSRLFLLDGPAGRGLTPVPLPRPVNEAVVDGSGTAWALSWQVGELYAVAPGGTPVTHRVSAPWERVQLTLAGDRPVVYIPERGQAAMFDRSGQVGSAALPQERTADGVRVAAPGADSRVLVAASRTKGELAKADFASGDRRRSQLNGRAGHEFGAPVVNHGRVYVPDYHDRHVVVLELASLRQIEWVPVPGHSRFEVFARDGRVWVNDPYDGHMLSFDRNGRRSEIDKNSGQDARESAPDRLAQPRPEPDPDIGPSGPPQNGPSGQPGKTETPRVRVPNVVGTDSEQAARDIEAKDLKFRSVNREGGCDTGRVLETDPRAGKSVRAGSAVVAVVCGPAEVPNLVGMTIDQARRALAQARFTPQEQVEGAARTPADVGRVLRQAPQAGTRLSTGDPVTVGYVDPRRGSRIVVPNLVGMTPEAACQNLSSMLLACNPVPVPHATANGVHGQDPPVNAQVVAGTSVRYNFQRAAPAPMNRYKARQAESRYLSLGGPPGGDGAWADVGSSAKAYPTTAMGQVPGLVGLHQASCGNCDTQKLYYHSRGNGTPANPPGNWVAAAAPDLACFDPAAAPPQTVPLVRMFKDFDTTTNNKRRWAIAPKPSGEYTEHRSEGYQEQDTVCNVWLR